MKGTQILAYKVKTDTFEGPFDLLLYLVSRKRVDIGAISISEITDQYLEEVAKMDILDLDVASDFLLVAATLLEIKAQSLIPKRDCAIDEEIAELAPNEAREMLIEKLYRYKQIKNASEELSSRFESAARLHERPFGPDKEFLGAMPDFLKDVSIDSLGYLAAGALARREIFLLESEHIAAKPIPVEVHVRAIHQRITSRKRLKFSELVAKDTTPALVVVSFLAILELYKRKMVMLEQESSFGDIDITYIEGSGELVLDGDDGSAYFDSTGGDASEDAASSQDADA